MINRYLCNKIQKALSQALFNVNVSFVLSEEFDVDSNYTTNITYYVSDRVDYYDIRTQRLSVEIQYTFLFTQEIYVSSLDSFNAAYDAIDAVRNALLSLDTPFNYIKFSESPENRQTDKTHTQRFILELEGSFASDCLAECFETREVDTTEYTSVTVTPVLKE
jgi:hypothetical protein